MSDTSSSAAPTSPATAGSSQATEKVIERIRKLMRHAQDSGATEAEYETYMGKVREMLDQYDLSENQVLASESAEGDAARKSAYESIVSVYTKSRAGGMPVFFRVLGNATSKICEVGYYVKTLHQDPNKPGTYFFDRKGNRQDREFIVFYGLPKDCEIAKALFMELWASLHAMAWLRCGKNGWKVAHDSYSKGFADQIWERAFQLHVARHASSASSADPTSGENTTTAIVLAKDAMIRRYGQEKLGLRPRRGRASGPKDGSAYSLGRKDGSNVDLGTRGIGRGPKYLT